MHKRLSLILIIFLSTSYLATSFAIDTRYSARVIDDFKARHEKILFESLPFTENGVNDILEKEYRMHGLEALRTRMADIESYYSEKKEETTGIRISLEDAIKHLDTSISSTEQSIHETREMIRVKQQQIQILDHASVELKRKIYSHRQIILEYLANLYSEGNLIMSDDGEVDIVQAMILSDADTDFHLTDITYKTLVSELGQKFVDEYRILVRQYYVNSVRTNEEKHGLESLEINLKKQMATLEAQKHERTQLLEITKGQEALYIQHIAQQQKAQQTVTDAWQKANEDYQISLERFLDKYGCSEANMHTEPHDECSRIQTFFAHESELARSEYLSGTENILIWPVESRRITSFFRDASYYNYLGSHHDAIDIATPQGSDIIAPADGYVYYILEPAPGNYSYIALKHKDGLVTVYGHLSEVHVTPYQFVRQGELIAKSGGAVGTPGAGPMTSGPHLHFEVWKDKKSVDPLRFMSLIDIDYPTLPSRYQKKFIDDLIERSGDDADTGGYKLRFSLRGETESDRQKYLLATYATPAFQNWDMWVDTALEAKIDPSFLMCIGLAETTLGNYLKTPYNIGNVGNTDSGDTISFSSAQEGLTWMGKTFNNRFLGKYTKVSELSRWGNQAGPIYASSSSNWHDNTIRCLTALKGRFVEDDYAFRIE